MEQWLAGDVTFLDKFGNDDERDVAHQALIFFDEIRVLSGLLPTDVLAMAGCADALYALAQDDTIVLEHLIRKYYEAGRANYIRHNMLGALKKVVDILQTLANGLRERGVSDDHLADWVRAGLDFPDKETSPASHMTATVTERDAERWKHAKAAAQDFLAHVEGLPMAVRRGAVTEDDVRDAVTETVREYLSTQSSDPPRGQEA